MNEEIYEGDIVEVVDSLGKTNIAVISWDEKYSGLYPQYNNMHWFFIGNENIIGNIYENPELLEVEQ